VNGSPATLTSAPTQPTSAAGGRDEATPRSTCSLSTREATRCSAPCRWLAKPVGVNALDDLYAARSVLGPKAAQTQLAIFSKNGFSEALRTRAETEDVHLIDVDDLFA